jgi:hypothetical protein
MSRQENITRQNFIIYVQTCSFDLYWSQCMICLFPQCFSFKIRTRQGLLFAKYV